MKIAVIGSGIAGLTLANRLRESHDVTVFEKARGVGGRMATRYSDHGQFDHGAQYFTAKTTAFQELVSSLITEGVIAPWLATCQHYDGSKKGEETQWGFDHPHYVATPKMNQLCKHLVSGFDVKLNVQVKDITRRQNQWRLRDAQGAELGLFDWVISTAPAPQTAFLLPESFAHHEAIQKARMLGCYTVMLAFNTPFTLPWQVARIKHSDVEWIAVNSSKPQRDDIFTLVVNASNSWSEAHIDDDVQDARQYLVSVASDIVGQDLSSAAACNVHRWRYALVDKTAGHDYLLDAEQQLAACGDWCVSGTVEGAFTSAYTLSTLLRSYLS